MNSIKFHILLILLLATSVYSFAQEKWENPVGKGGIEDAQVVIEKDKVIKLRPVSRRFKTIRIEVPAVKPLSLNYSLAEIKDSLPSLQVIVRPKTMRNQPLDKLYGVVAKLGYGNYQSPYVLINANTKRSDEYFLAGYINHYSSGKGPVLGDFSGAGITNVGGSGKYFLNDWVLYGDLNYRHQTYTVYGYDQVEITNVPFDLGFLRQKLNVYSFNLGIVENNLKDNLDHDLKIGINYLKNNHSSMEFLFDAKYLISGTLSDEWSFKTDVNFTSFTQNGITVINTSRRYVQLKPVIGYTLNNLYLNVGINIVNENDPISLDNNCFHFMPIVGAKYDINNNHSIKVLVDGNVEKVSLNSLYNQNPYLDSLTQASNNVNNIAGILALDGNLSSKVGYSLSYQFKRYDRLYFFMNDTPDTARFNIVYDQGGASLNRVYGSVNYLPSEDVVITADIAYNLYKTVDLIEAWHKPTFEVSVTSNFKILPKLRGHLTYFLLNGIKAQTSLGETVTLDMINDLNFGLELALTERAGIFIDMLNIFGSNYQLYNNYPVKGFQLIGGLSYKF